MGYNYKTQPFKHQLDALAQSAYKKNFAYFMEMGCVDGETEFLTPKGWCKFNDFELDEWERPFLVAQAVPDPKDVTRWACEFVEPTSFIRKPAYEWIHLKSRRYYMRNMDGTKKVAYSTELVFTKDHVLPIHVAARDNTMDTYDHSDIPEISAGRLKEDIDSKKFMLYSYIPACTAGFKGVTSEYYHYDEELHSLTDDELRFMVAVLADGTFPNRRNNKCDFYFVKDRKAERLRELAAKAGIPLAYEYVRTRIKPTHVFHAIAPIKCKEFDERWYSLPQSKLRVIVEELFYWDGWRCVQEAQYYTAIKDCADFAQFALAMCGWPASISYQATKRLYTVRVKYNKCPDSSLVKAIATYASTKGLQHVESAFSLTFTQEVHEERMSYCFRVPSGFLFLRRKGKTFIASNSGKTKVMLDNIGMLYKDEKITGALILAPKGVYRNWSAKEIPTHLPDDIERDVLVWDAAASQGKKDKLAKQIADWDGKKLQLMVFNIESLISEKGKKLIVSFIKRHAGNVLALVDESTCIKNHKAKRTKAAIELASKCKARRIATGSPITNSPLDLYAQCAFLDKSLLGCGSYYAFKNTYAIIEKIQNRQGQHYEKILAYRNLDKLSNILDKFSYRVTKKECLDLPDKIYQTRDVELTPEQLKIYNEMANYQFALLQQGEEFKEMSAQIILTKLLRLHQVLCGTFVADDGTAEYIPNNRLQSLHEVLEEASGKVIIWANYRSDISQISKMLTEWYGADSFVTYFGDTSADDRVKAIELFQDEESPVRFFLGNTQTAGKGITLTAASTVVYYSNNFSLELRQQSEDRAHRFGQKNKVTYVDLVVRGSLDEKIIKSLLTKRNIANEILKDDLDEWITLQPS